MFVCLIRNNWMNGLCIIQSVSSVLLLSDTLSLDLTFRWTKEAHTSYITLVTMGTLELNNTAGWKHKLMAKAARQRVPISSHRGGKVRAVVTRSLKHLCDEMLCCLPSMLVKNTKAFCKRLISDVCFCLTHKSELLTFNIMYITGPREPGELSVLPGLILAPVHFCE